ncbi:MAG TPA: hypothetical protein VEK57_23495 [Thermoanaerobaculia bacterium]|nr:hypothetical protein [Thermoanaerobaculia bacterium]
MNIQEPLTIIGPVGLAVPLLVSAVICIVARREGNELPAGPLLRVTIATAAAIAALRFFPHPILMIVLSLATFWFFAIPVMQALERTALARMAPEPVRSATLVPRRVGAYVPLGARTAGIAAALGLLLIVIERSLTGTPTLMTYGFTFAGLTFFGLYAAWMRDEVFSVRARDEAERRARVRAVFGAQTVLTLSLLVLAALSAGPWPGLVPLATIATIIGGTGCAFALSTGIQERYLQVWTARQ